MAIMRLPALIAVILAAASTAACGIGNSVMDPCLQKRNVYEYETAKRSGMKNRGVAPESPTYRRAAADVARAREALSSCEAAHS